MLFILVGIYGLLSGIYDAVQSNLEWMRKYICTRSEEQVADDILLGDVYHYRKFLFVNLVTIVLWMIIGAIVIKSGEQLTWIEAFYFVVQTSSVS
jgi:hypothetical protein